MNTNISSLLNSINSKSSLPSGTVTSFAGNNAPKGWLLCNGETVSRETYKNLFEIIGTIYGNGDGTTTFTLPDMRGKVSVAAGTGAGLTNRVLGTVGGEENHLLTINEIPSHTHTYDKQNGVNPVPIPVPTPVSTPTDEIFSSVNSGATGGGAAHNVMQPYVVLNHIIKY